MSTFCPPHSTLSHTQQWVGTHVGYNQPMPLGVPTANAKCIASRFRTKLCDKWLDSNGQCPYGGRCMFAHGPQELRTTEMNVRDGLTDEETIRVFKRYVQLRNAGIEVQLPSCLQRVDWGAGRPLVLPEPQPSGRSATASDCGVGSGGASKGGVAQSPVAFRWCPYSSTRSKVFFEESYCEKSLGDSGRTSPAHSAESTSSDEPVDFPSFPEYEI